MNKQYLIKQIWVNPIENSPSAAVGYKSIGYVTSEERAQEIIATGRLFIKKDCWAIMHPMPEFIYSTLTKIE